MKKGIIAFVIGLFSINLIAQEDGGVYQNVADKLLASNSQLTIGGYAQIDYNQPLDAEKRYNGTLDVHRLVLLFGYNFNERTQFVSEIEYEHVSELYVEQAFLQYKINNWLNFRGGLMLIPMGIVNEYHEPTTYNGVERPFIDNTISPTTWRELGAGFTGTILPASLKYQVYVVNGFNGYSAGSGKFNGRNGFRSGRQKGAESFISSPNLSAKVEYYGIRGLNLGLSGYFGDSQSSLYNNIDKNDDVALANADKSVVGISMVGADARYQTGALQLRGQYYYAAISNTEDYNTFTAVNGTPNNLGSAMQGYYAEAAYNVFKHFDCQTELVPFVRYEAFNTHQKTAGSLTANPAFDKTAVVAGLGWRVAPGAVLKADMQWVKSAADSKAARAFNAGIGVMF